MPSTIGQITVGTTRVRLTTASALTGITSINDMPITRGIRVNNASSGLLYMGGSGVTTANGYLLSSPDQIAPNDFALLGDIYLISDTASQAVTFDIMGQVFA